MHARRDASGPLRKCRALLCGDRRGADGEFKFRFPNPSCALQGGSRRGRGTYEVAAAFLFLACEDASYMTGQALHPDGGDETSSYLANFPS